MFPSVSSWEMSRLKFADFINQKLVEVLEGIVCNNRTLVLIESPDLKDGQFNHE